MLNTNGVNKCGSFNIVSNKTLTFHLHAVKKVRESALSLNRFRSHTQYALLLYDVLVKFISRHLFLSYRMYTLRTREFSNKTQKFYYRLRELIVTEDSAITQLAFPQSIQKFYYWNLGIKLHKFEYDRDVGNKLSRYQFMCCTRGRALGGKISLAVSILLCGSKAFDLT